MSDPDIRKKRDELIALLDECSKLLVEQRESLQKVLELADESEKKCNDLSSVIRKHHRSRTLRVTSLVLSLLGLLFFFIIYL